ncbi:MAG TPA: ATP-binding cassette domain-containing protein [Saprospiraceae bacterium]|nr:ATP-binding cassette domain-containing protein [Saprospiraceae bacterium]
MEIVAQSVWKKYNKHWIISDFNYHFKQAKTYGITGPNGSGKSTLMAILSKQLIPSKGLVQYNDNNGIQINPTSESQLISFTAPYIELYDSLSLKESIQFHNQFRPFYSTIGYEDCIDQLELKKFEHQRLQSFSSGMKQRVKLAISIFTQSEILLLDEPGSFLDDYWRKKYSHWIQSYANNRIVLISSNDADDFSLVDEFVPWHPQ